MRRSLLPLLSCPDCTGDLDFTSFTKEDASADIAEGAFVCNSCKAFFPLTGGVPRFLPDALNSHPSYANRFQAEISALAKKGAHVDTRGLTKLKQDTIRNFGSEWETWNKFGWGDGQSIAQARKMFDYKVLFTEQELAGALVLDAGCGNGRYSKAARDYGATVVGIDLSDAVDAAAANFKDDPGVHIVQGDLMHPPFKKGSFDLVFSNGVLMHTGDAKRAFLSLVPLLGPKGSITVHLYHKGNFIYETADATLRAITTRLPLSFMYRASKLAAGIAKLFPRYFLDNAINALVRLEPHPHFVFDWYTAPIATHHTYPEVYAWLEEAGLSLEHDHNATNRPFLRKLAPFLFMTVRAGRARRSAPPRHTRD